MWLLRPTGGRSDSLGRPAMWWSANSCVVVGTEGATDAGSRPLVSFWGAQGSRAEEHCHTSICHHCSFDCKCVGTFCQLPSSSGQWSVAATIQVQNLGVESTGWIPWAGHRWQYTGVAVTLKTLNWTKAIWASELFTRERTISCRVHIQYEWQP